MPSRHNYADILDITAQYIKDNDLLNPDNTLVCHCIECGALTLHETASKRTDVNGMYCDNCYHDLIKRRKGTIYESIKDVYQSIGIDYGCENEQL